MKTLSIAGIAVSMIVLLLPSFAHAQDGWIVSRTITGATVIKQAAGNAAGLDYLETAVDGAPAGISRIVAVNALEQGWVVLEADVESFHVRDSGHLLLYIQGSSKRVPSVVFQNLTVENVLKSGGKGRIVIRMPFEQRVDSVRAGLFLKGSARIKISRLRFGTEQGEFAEGWNERHMEKLANPEFTADIMLLARVWGYLKYFSPVISRHDLDWDGMLVRQLDYLFEFPGAKLHTAILEMLDAAAPAGVTDGKKQGAAMLAAATANEKVNVDYSWMRNAKQLTKADRARMQALADDFRPFRNKYISTPDSNRAPSPAISEDTYGSNKLPEMKYRLLALFRYWNILEYYAPNRYQLKDEWPATLSALIPVFTAARTGREYNIALMRLNAAKKDGHGHITSAAISELAYTGRKTRLPFTLGVIADTVFVKQADSLFTHATGIRGGDRIISINGVQAGAYVDSLERLISEPRKEMKQYYITANGLLGQVVTAGDSLNLCFINEAGRQQVTVPYGRKEMLDYARASLSRRKQQKTIVPLRMLEGNVLYIDPSAWTKKDADTTRRLLSSVKAVVIDCRTYPNFDFIHFSSCFHTKKSDCLLWMSTLSYPGLLKGVMHTCAPDPAFTFSGKVAVLISEASVSRPEMLTMFLQARKENTMLVGRATGGADGDISTIPMVGDQDMTFVYTGLGVLYPNGRETQGAGIRPDIHVPAGRRDYTGPGDPILERALQYLLTN